MPDQAHEPNDAPSPFEDSAADEFALSIPGPAERFEKRPAAKKPRNWMAIGIGAVLHLGALVLLGLFLAGAFDRREPESKSPVIVREASNRDVPVAKPVVRGGTTRPRNDQSDKLGSEPTTVSMPRDSPPASTGESVLWMAEATISGLRNVSFARDSKQLITGGNDRVVRIWEAASGRQTHTFTDYSSPGAGVGLSSDGNFFISSGNEATTIGRVRIQPDALLRARGLEATRDTLVGAHGEKITCLSLSGNGKNALTGSADQTVRWWEIKTARELKVFKGHKSSVRAVDFSPKHSQCASVDDTGSVIVWELMTGRNLGRIDGLSGGVRSIDYAPDGKSILAVDDGGLAILDVPTLKLTRRIPVAKDSKLIATGACWAPNGTAIIVGTDQGVIAIEAVSGKKQTVLDFPTPGSSGLAPIAAVAISADGRYVAAAGSGLWLWELKTPLGAAAEAGESK